MTLAQNSSNGGYWLIVNGREGSAHSEQHTLYSFNVSSSGLSPTPVMSNFSSAFTTAETQRMVLKVSPDNTTLGILESIDRIGDISLLTKMNFNSATGQFSNQTAVSVSSSANFKANSFEFSSDSQKVYLIKDNLLVKDLSTPGVYARTITTPTLPTPVAYGSINLWHIQRDKYSHILLAGNGLNYLAKIDNQNSYANSVLVLNYVNLNNALPSNNSNNVISNTLPQFIPGSSVPSDCPSLGPLTSEPNTSNFIYSGYSNITVGTNYNITQTGLDIQMEAGDYIRLLPDSYVKTGSNYRARIIPCFMHRFSNYDSASGDDEQSNLKIKGVSIYPNPTNSIFTIDSRNQKITGIEIYSIDGKLIYNENVNTDTFKLDISSYSRGIYIINIQTNNGEKVSRKLIKE